LERKKQTRIVKEYQRKSDQERIEKKEHEEERILKVREYEYMNRAQKASPEELEFDRLELRSFHFVTHRGENSASRRVCKFGENCSLCGPVDENSRAVPVSESSHQTAAIYNPRFRRVDSDDIDDSEGEDQGSAKKVCRRSRTAELNSQRKVSAKKLKEMYNTLEFIEKYNTGLIITTGKRKSRK
jgi:hypothetical protein